MASSQAGDDAPSFPVVSAAAAIVGAQHAMPVAATLQHLHAVNLRYADGFVGVPLVRIGTQKADVNVELLTCGDCLTDVILVDLQDGRLLEDKSG